MARQKNVHVQGRLVELVDYFDGKVQEALREIGEHVACVLHSGVEFAESEVDPVAHQQRIPAKEEGIFLRRELEELLDGICVAEGTLSLENRFSESIEDPDDLVSAVSFLEVLEYLVSLPGESVFC
jgi:hypothetical protein